MLFGFFFFFCRFFFLCFNVFGGKFPYKELTFYGGDDDRKSIYNIKLHKRQVRPVPEVASFAVISGSSERRKGWFATFGEIKYKEAFVLRRAS